MNTPALILAAHGSRSTAANAEVQALADSIARRYRFAHVTPAFNQGNPTFAVVLDRLRVDEAIVVPLMTSRGYFSEEFLPAELARNKRFGRMRVCTTLPVGTHPRIVTVVADEVDQLLADHGLVAEETTLAIVGHGTVRRQRSGEATIELSAALQQRATCAEVLPAFLDDTPPVESILGRATRQNLVVVPFLIAAGGHATVDIPERLGLERGHGGGGSAVDTAKGRPVYVTPPVGTFQGIRDIVVSLAGAMP